MTIDFLSINDLSKEEIVYIVEEAIKLKQAGKKIKRTDLQNLVVATMFFEPSTRTRLSFEAATLLSGGNYIDMGEIAQSSMAKGENFSDTIKMVNGYAHIIIIRHPESGAAHRAAMIADVPVINAGDGENEHPTQALQDIMTLYEQYAEPEKLTIGIMGDLKYGRTVHSLIYGLVKLGIKKLVLIPCGKLSIPNSIKENLLEAGIDYEVTENLEEVIKKLDVLYVTRVQKERFSTNKEVEGVLDNYFVSSNVLEQNSKLKVMHPLPRVNELDRKIDEHHNALYFEQAENGVYIRQILLRLLAEKIIKIS